MLFYVRVDEIFLKGNNQKMFFEVLRENLKKLFSPAMIKRTEGGLLLDIKKENLARLCLVPGVAKVSPAAVSNNELSDIAVAALSFFDGEYTNKSFAVDTTRSYKKYPLNSQDISKEVGGIIAEKTGMKVNLSVPDVKINIFLTKEESYVCVGEYLGIGGLPTGTSGKVLCLLSGGIDSPVAAYMMMKRGAQIELIHFQNQTQVTQEVSQKIFDLARMLSSYQPEIKLHIVPFANWQKQVLMKIPADYRMLITRRLMFFIAANVAKKQKCLGLATGDSLGQVASQTLENLEVIYKATDMLKLNPLSGTNKTEAVHLAQKIGTLDISNRPYEDCCSLYVAKHPQTRAKINKVEELEKDLDLSTIDKTEVISYNISMK